MKALIVGELGMERRREQIAVTRRDAWNGPPDIPSTSTSASNESICRPKALRSTVMSINSASGCG